MNKIFFLCIIFFFACKQKVSRDIPINKKGDKVLSYRWDSLARGKLSLRELKHGYDSLAIRFWYSQFKVNQNYIVEFFYKHDSLVGKKVTYSTGAWYFDSAIMYSALKIIPQSVNEKRLTISKLQFDSITSYFKIPFLPNMHNIPNLIDNVADGNSYGIEVATKNSYRFYEYTNPELFKEQFKEAELFFDFTQFVERNF